MKQIILPFLVITVCSLGTMVSAVESRAALRPDTIPASDSLALFHDITNISKQIERRTGRSKEVVNPPVTLPGNAVPATPTDSILLFTNSLDSIYLRKENGTLQLPDNFSNSESMAGLTFRDTLFYDPLFLPMIFTGEILPRELSFYPLEDDHDKGTLIPREETFAPRLDHVDFVRKVRRNYYIQYPNRIKYSVASFDSIPRLKTDDRVVRETFNPFRELIKVETAYSLTAPGVEGGTIGRKYWVRSGDHSFHFAQNTFSDNWHKGGTNNLNFNSQQIFRANYKKDKVKFNNTLEWRLSLFNAPDDSLRKYRIGNDLIRYYGNFGVDAFLKGWSYTTNLEAKSQMLDAHPINSKNILSSFLSPLYVHLGVGLTYTLDKPSTKVRHRKIRLDLSMDPISIDYKYVWSDSVNVKRFGIPEGEKGLLDIGTTVRAILKYNFTKYITWDANMSYFTSYEKVIFGFENTLDLALSNALSTKLYVNVRFDDGVPADPKLKYWQLSHTLSFGLNYKW